MAQQSPDMDITVQVDEPYRDLVGEEWLRSIALAVLTSEGVGGPTALSITITDDETVRRLNAEYLGEDAPTDVLSFPLTGDDEDFVLPPNEPRHLGDVIIACPVAQRQAGEQGHSLQREIAHLLIHGTLHLLGYDHAEPEEEWIMFGKTEQLLASIMRQP